MILRLLKIGLVIAFLIALFVYRPDLLTLIVQGIKTGIPALAEGIGRIIDALVAAFKE